MLPLFCFFIVCKLIVGSHFDGGIIRWVPVSKNVTTSPVQIMIIQTYTYTLSSVTCTVGSLIGTTIYGYNFDLWCIQNCGATSAGYVAPPILGYCTGSNSGLNLAFAQRTDIVNLTANDYFSIAYSIPSTATQGYYRALTLSSGGTDSTAQWNITATIDIRPRADNGLINTPPVATIMSPYGIPYNIPTQIVITTMDVDGDDVRCRWGNSTLECGDVCFPQTIPVSTILSTNCILTITGTSTTGWYCAAIQVEDFLNTSTSLQPMSSTAVQFLIYVYTPKNCSVPRLTSPSTCVGVRVGISYTLTLTVINSCGSSSNISSIAVQAFTGISQGHLVLITPNKTVYEMNITYTPIASQVGLQILCATALDNTNIPSNQYCITFIVGSTVAPTCPGAINTTIQTTTSTISTTNGGITAIAVGTSTTKSTMITSAENPTINDGITSIAVDTSSSESAIITSPENLPTTHIEITSEATTTSLSTTRLILSTTSSSKPKPNDWPLIGSIIGIISLLALLGSCCVCYHYLWSAAARRRRRRKEDKHTRRYQPVSEIVTDSIKIAYPPKPYQIYDIDTDRAKSSNTIRTSLGTRTSSSIRTNSIRPETTENPPINRIHDNKPLSSLSRPFSTTITTNDVNSFVNITELKQVNSSTTDRLSNTDSINENRVKSTVSITRVPSTKRYKSTSTKRKIRQPSVSKVLVTRIKK